MDEYISRKEAIDKMRSLQSRFRAKNDLDSGYDTAIAEAFEHIKRVPAADVQPVKHGRCVIDNEGYERCSVCNEHETGMRYFTFCPHCGAKMDGGEEDENG